MISYVMFGQSPLFGDYVDTIHALGGRLTKVVFNVDEQFTPERKTFANRIEEYHRYLERAGVFDDVAIQPLDEFEPKPGERHVIGFRGVQVAPLRRILDQRFGLSIDSLIHPSAYLSPTAQLGEGVAINPLAVIASSVKVRAFCMINRGATIGHDCTIDDFANIGPGVDIASNVHVARGAVIGLGAKVIEDLEIGENAYVAAGAVVLKSVEPDTLVAGVPAEFKRRRNRAAVHE